MRKLMNIKLALSSSEFEMQGYMSQHETARIFSAATQWACAEALRAWPLGVPASDAESEIARKVGVQSPELIRLVSIDELALPKDVDFISAISVYGMLGKNMIGLTIGCVVFIKKQQYLTRLLSHEFRHVCQYELAGSVSNFMSVYLEQIVNVGYLLAPLELDAVAHEIM